MINCDKYKIALDFAAKKHEGQFRIGGQKYISHPMAVAELLKQKGYPIDYQITGLFHDLLEDTDATEKEILDIGGNKVLETVIILTKTPNYIMAEYVDKIKKNEIARAVKAADRLHNLQSAFCASEDFKRRYILETVDWYLDLSSEIPAATKTLIKSLKKPIAELPLEYRLVDKFI